ncbi:prepilin peptidase [Chloroflexota bacterium]
MLFLMPVFTLLGLFVGSFLNVCIDRLPLGKSIVKPPSHCSACQQKLGVRDLVPLFSYLYLRGNCRYCQAHIPLRIPIVEGTTGLLFSLLYWHFGLGIELVISLVYASLLAVIFVIDLENHLILDIITYPAMVLAIVFSFFWPGVGELTSLQVGSIKLSPLVSALAGGAFGLATQALPFVLTYRRGGMGFGDVKLGALVGLMTGLPLIILAVLAAWIVGGLVAAALLAFKIKQPKDPIPSGTFLAVSAMVILVWGQLIWQWYLP